MHQLPVALLLGGMFAMDVGVAPAQGALPTGNVSQARVAWTFSAARLCPSLQISADGSGAVVLFRVGRTGSPASAVIRSTSHSAQLDEAALQCIQRLRFQPATRLGDGEPVESWQQLAWVWAAQPHGTEAGIKDAPALGTPPSMESNTGGRVTVRACADEAGKLSQDPIIVQSSGKPQLDEAALHIARLGAPYYPRQDASNGRGPGCAQLVIDFGSK